MTAEMEQELRRTWALAATDADAAMRLFYETLFARAPDLRTLFAASDMAGQRRKLAGALSLVVAAPNLPPQTRQALRKLGQRHAEAGVVAEDYATVGAALIETFERALGPAFTPAARTAWTAAYEAVANLMLDGADASARAIA